MMPIVEQLEARCVLSAALDLGTIGPTETFIGMEAIAAASKPDALPRLQTPSDVWTISPATVGPDTAATRIGPGEYSLWHGMWDDPYPDLEIDRGTLTRFTLLSAVSVGLGVDGSTVTATSRLSAGSGALPVMTAD